MTRESTIDGEQTAEEEQPTEEQPTATDDWRTIDPVTDPAALRDRDGVDVRQRTETVGPGDFEAAGDDLADVAGWVVVGVENDAGAVLLMDDGDHGWTLPAAPVDPDEDWVAAGRDLVEGLTDATVAVVKPERVRRLDYEREGGDGRGSDDHVVVHHVVFRAESVTGEPAADEPVVGCDTAVEVGWFDALPAGVEGTVADDARLFL